jgi:hypothetical protein
MAFYYKIYGHSGTQNKKLAENRSLLFVTFILQISCCTLLQIYLY